MEKELTGKESEPSDLIYFKVHQSQIPVVEQGRSRRRPTYFPDLGTCTGSALGGHIGPKASSHLQ